MTTGMRIMDLTCNLQVRKIEITQNTTINTNGYTVLIHHIDLGASLIVNGSATIGYVTYNNNQEILGDNVQIVGLQQINELLGNNNDQF